MKITNVIRALAKHAGMSMYDVSRALDHAPAWAGVVAGREGVALATIADVADVAGCDVVIRDRATGDDVGVIEPPRRCE